MGHGIELTTESTEHNCEDLASKIPVVNLSELFVRNLEEGAFPAAYDALTHLDRSRSNLGNACIFEPTIDQQLLERMQQAALDQELFPVQEVTGGINRIEYLTQLTLRLLLHSFHGTRLWEELLKPYFNHIHLGPILMDKGFTDIFVYDMEPPMPSYDMNTPNARVARWIDSLMYRAGVPSKNMRWTLHQAIADFIRENNGVTAYDNPEEWEPLYAKYFALNDHLLVTKEQEEFMEDRALIAIEVDLPTAFSSQSLVETFCTDEVVDYVLSTFRSGDHKRVKLNDPVLELLLDEIVGYAHTMIHVGQRDLNKENILKFIQTALEKRKSKYTFYAAVRTEYLERVGV